MGWEGSMKKIVALSLVSVLGACAQPPTQSQGAEGLVVKQHDQTNLDATYTSAGQTLRVTSVEVGSKVVDITYDFGSNVVAFRLDYAAGAGDFMTSGQPFDAAEVRLASKFLQAL